MTHSKSGPRTGTKNSQKKKKMTKHLEKYSSLFAIREMRTETTLRFIFLKSQCQRLTKQPPTNAGQEIENGNSHSVLARLQVGSETLEIRVESSPNK